MRRSGSQSPIRPKGVLWSLDTSQVLPRQTGSPMYLWALFRMKEVIWRIVPVLLLQCRKIGNRAFDNMAEVVKSQHQPSLDLFSEH